MISLLCSKYFIFLKRFHYFKWFHSSIDKSVKKSDFSSLLIRKSTDPYKSCDGFLCDVNMQWSSESTRPVFHRTQKWVSRKATWRKKSITVISYTSAKLPKSSSFATHFHFLKCHAKYFFDFRQKSSWVLFDISWAKNLECSCTTNFIFYFGWFEPE